MQGRPGQGNEPWERSSGDRLASVNGTGKRRPPLQRPSTMPHVDAPPPTQRVARPRRQTPPRTPTNWRRRLIILVVVFIVCGLLAWGIGYAVVNFVLGINAASGASNVASDFLGNLSTQNYDQAFNDLDATITVNLTKDQFRQQALKDDRCYGPVTGFTEVQNSATSQGNTQSYTYSITRKNLAKSYQLRLTLEKDPNGNWDITSYGNNDDLGPGQPPCN